jgi:hypothetical protein
MRPHMPRCERRQAHQSAADRAQHGGRGPGWCQRGNEPARRTYRSNVSPEEVGVFVESLPQVKRKGSAAHPAWYVDDRLIARLLDPTTLLIRVPLSRRDTLIVTYPTSFGVPPRFEAHHKVEAYLDRAEPTAIRTAIELAWEMQRR